MASEPEKDDLAEEETDDAEAERDEPVAPPAKATKASTSSGKASSKSASTKSTAPVAKKKPVPVVVEEEDDEDEEEDDEDEDEDEPPPPPKKVVKKKGKKGKAAVVTAKTKPTTKRRKVGPKKPAKAFIPHAVVALAFGYADSRMNAEAVPFHPLAVIGIIILVYAFINIGSANEVGTETALASPSSMHARAVPSSASRGKRSLLCSALGPPVARSAQRQKISLASARRPRSRSAVPHKR